MPTADCGDGHCPSVFHNPADDECISAYERWRTYLGASVSYFELFAESRVAVGDEATGFSRTRTEK